MIETIQEKIRRMKQLEEEIDKSIKERKIEREERTNEINAKDYYEKEGRL